MTLRPIAILRGPGACRALLPALCARIPDSIAGTCIVVLIRSVTHSYAAAGVAAAAFSIGTAVSAPAAGRAMDRIGQRRVLPALAAVFAAALATMALAAGPLGGAGLSCLAAVAGLTRPPLEAGMRALWPRLVAAADVDAAYTLDSTVQELIWIVGPLMLSVLLALGQPALPLLACAALSVGGTVAYATSPDLPAARAAEADETQASRESTGRESITRESASRESASRESVSPLRSPQLRVLLYAGSLYGVSSGMLTIALVASAVAHGSPAWAGVLVAVWGVASMAGGLAVGARSWRWPPERRAMLFLAAFAVALALLAAAPSLPLLVAAMIPLGLPLAPWLGALSSSVQRAAPPSTVTEAFTWNFTVITIGQSAGSAVAGLVIEAAGLKATFLAAAAASACGAVLGVARSRMIVATSRL